jgi:hypothetical protein
MERDDRRRHQETESALSDGAMHLRSSHIESQQVMHPFRRSQSVAMPRPSSTGNDEPSDAFDTFCNKALLQKWKCNRSTLSLCRYPFRRISK